MSLSILSLHAPPTMLYPPGDGDYLALLATVTFESDTAQECVGVAITDDDIVEQQEEFCVVLEPESEFVDIGTNIVATVTISDNGRH